jgi:hypothetical protein
MDYFRRLYGRFWRLADVSGALNALVAASAHEVADSAAIDADAAAFSTESNALANSLLCVSTNSTSSASEFSTSNSRLFLIFPCACGSVTGTKTPRGKRISQAVKLSHA